MSGWYHDSCSQGTTEIVYFDSPPKTSEYVSWHGPFGTFGDAKRDALAYHRGTKADSEQYIRDIKLMKKSELK